MIVNTLAILSQHGDSLVQQIKQAIAPHSATGKTASSLQFSVRREGTKDILQITGRPFIMALETGRKATRLGAPTSDPNLVEAIKEWMEAKGISGSAYAIAKSIHKKGTKGTAGIISEPVDSMVDMIQKDILEQFAKQWLFNVVQFSDKRN